MSNAGGRKPSARTIASRIEKIFNEAESLAASGFSDRLAAGSPVAGLSITGRLNQLFDLFRAQIDAQSETARLQQDALDGVSKATDEINNLRELSAAIALAQTRDEIVQLLLGIIRENVFDFGASALFQDMDDTQFRLAGNWNTTEDDRREIDRQVDEGFLEWVIRAQAPVIMPSKGKYPTALYIPMNAGNRTTGILLLLASRAIEDFTKSDLDRLSLLCSQAAVALENARLVGQLIEIKQYNENIVHSMTSGLLAVDPAGIVTTANAAGLATLGMTEQNVIGRLITSIEPLAGLARMIVKTIDSGAVSRNIELPVSLGEKKLVIGVSVSPLLTADKRVTGAMAIFTDLTPIKMLEQQVRRADRLAAVGQLAAGAAHEIRNPLSAIRGTMQLLNRKLQKMSDAGEIMAKTTSIIEEVDRINRIVAGMMGMSKEGGLALKRMSVNDVLRDVGYIVEGNFKAAGVAIDLVLGDAGQVGIDPAEMKQVFLNLYQNALQAMKENGRLTVISRIETDDAGADWARVDVTDTGCGIDAKHLEKIFEPFFTTKSDGTGLGLSIVHRIIRDHQGRISATSGARGTTFTVVLPIAPAP